MVSNAEIESIEVNSKRSYPGLYIVLEGPGSTGKTSLQRSLRLSFYGNVYRFREDFSFYDLAEPPIWDALTNLGILSPYEMTTSGYLSNPYTALLALTAFRRMQWLGAKLDGELLDPFLLKTLYDPKGVIVASRSPLSSVYQEIYPGSVSSLDKFWQIGSIFQDFYSWEIPFPDILYVLMPDPQEQRKRLEKRIQKEGPTDIGDDPQKQHEILEGYENILALIHNWPGVYRIHSQEIIYPSSMNLSFLLGMHSLCTFIEKGGVKTYINPASWGTSIYPELSYLYRVRTPRCISAYIFYNSVNNLIDFKWTGDIFRQLSQEEGIWFGDIGAISHENHFILISIETPSEINCEQAAKLARELVINNEVVLVGEENRYGWHDLYGRYEIEREWKNIRW